MTVKISRTTNKVHIYIYCCMSLLGTSQNQHSDQWRICIINIFTSSTCYARNHVFAFWWTEQKTRLIRFYIIVILSEKKNPRIRKKLINLNIYIYMYIYNVCNCSKHCAGQNPGWEGQCLHWYLLSFHFPCWRQTTQCF